jgi:hypothetical protein
MMLKRSAFPTVICSSLLLLLGCGGSSSSGTTDGSGGAGAGTSNGSGGQAQVGSGGTAPSSGSGSGSGSGGSVTVPAGSGGAATPSGSGGAGGSKPAGTGGAAVVGTGGAASPTGSGGAGPAGSGGVSGAGGASSTGGAAATGTGGGGGPPATGNEFWISPTGKDTNPGTKDAPLFSLCDDDLKAGACYKVCPTGVGCMAGGATIWVMDGTYKYGTVTQKIGSTKLGTAAAPYNVFAVAGAAPVFDFTGQPVAATSRGIQLQGDYWHIKGITVMNAGDSGIFVMGNHDTIELCSATRNNDTGIMIGVNSSRAPSGTYNTILNCDSYQNDDPVTMGANADGFGAKENSGEGNVFDGCRSWDNADDGFDFYGWASPVTVKNSWAFNEGGTTAGSQSNGNGFKMGGNKVSAVHVMSNLFAFDNNGNGGHKADWGFTYNSNPASMTCTGCASWNNAGGTFEKIAHVNDVTAPTGVTAAKAAAAKRNADGSLPDITKL